MDVMWQYLLNEWMNADGRRKYVYLEGLVLWVDFLPAWVKMALCTWRYSKLFCGNILFDSDNKLFSEQMPHEGG